MNTAEKLEIADAGTTQTEAPKSQIPTAAEAREKARGNFKAVIYYAIDKMIAEGIAKHALNVDNVDAGFVKELETELQAAGYGTAVSTHVVGAKGIKVLTIKF